MNLLLDPPERFVASRAKCLDLPAIICKKISGRWVSEKAESPRKELKESEWTWGRRQHGHSLYSDCCGRKKSREWRDTHGTHAKQQKRKKQRGRDLMIKYNKDLFTNSWQ